MDSPNPRNAAQEAFTSTPAPAVVPEGGAAPAAQDADPGFDTIEEVKRVFALQQQHRWNAARTTPKERIARLDRLRAAIIAHKDEILDAVHQDFRKSPVETDLTEVFPVLQELQHTSSHLEEWLNPRSVKTPLLLSGTKSEVRYDPRGVVLILGPWNYPFQLVMNPLISAVASGNCVIARPSEKVVHTGKVLKKVLRAVFEEREVALFTGGTDLADQMLDLPFDHIFFTGSTRVGQRVLTKAAQHLSSVTLELGGKSPTIVDETADVRAAAERIVWGKFINAGQTCIAPDYVLLHEKVRDAFFEAARAAIERYYGESEDARKGSKDLARIIDARAFSRLEAHLKETIAMGARVEIGGQSDLAQNYIAPTVLSGVSPSSPLMKEEIFGPILPVLTIRDLDEAIGMIHRLGKPLSLYLFSRNNANVEHVLRNTSSGGVTVNNTLLHFLNTNLPFGGVGPSGLGACHGEAGIKAFSHQRAVLRQGRPEGTKLFRPPYTRTTRKVLDLVVRLFT